MDKIAAARADLQMLNLPVPWKWIADQPNFYA
jgi:hypothetical protein